MEGFLKEKSKTKSQESKGKVLAREASEINAVVSKNLHFRGQLAVNLLNPRRITDFALLTSLLPSKGRGLTY